MAALQQKLIKRCRDDDQLEFRSAGAQVQDQIHTTHPRQIQVHHSSKQGFGRTILPIFEQPMASLM